jgi:predicted nuclease of predicted toxin-antitoxin system
MKLLFDHHLSRKLVARLADLFPQSSHVVFHDLARAEDIDIWRFAHNDDYLIVTKDADFNDVVTLRGTPPKVIWIRIGNCTTATIEALIRRNYPLIAAFYQDPQSAILEII